MIKLVLRIKELNENKMSIELKQLTEKEYLSSTQNEKITACEIKNALEELIKKLKDMKEGE